MCRTPPFAGTLCLILFAAARLMAAGPAGGFPFTVDSWSAEDGLPDNEANSVVQTKDGYLWVGTSHGLARFDGIQFTRFDEMNTPALKSDGIAFLFQDSQSNLWIGTSSSGLAVIEHGKIRSFEKETEGAGQIVGASEQGGDILFYSENGFVRYHDGQISYYPGVRSLQLYLIEQHWYV
ncbi:MAG: ligand-binding sensor domain-containing protein, partial [Limisphaerales bacterium]